MYGKRRYWFILPLLFLMLAIGIGAWSWNNFSHSPKTGNVTNTFHAPATLTGSTPVGQHRKSIVDINDAARLVIPAIGVNAPIEPVGVDGTGRLAVPSKNQWDGVGWYHSGPVPGQSGSAVIDGHLDRPGWKPAVFWELNQLHQGDVVMVTDAQKHLLLFHVLRKEFYTPTSAPIDKIFGNNTGVYLNLITCAGEWIPAEHQTTQRLVVYTQLA